MPAKSFQRIDEDGTYHHIYNRGVEKRLIFNDKEDYEIFLGYLQDYLTEPRDPASTKKAFTINGRTFRGTPHQPKNYFNKVELIAYSLRPDRFHLLLHQKTRGSLESFIRSLCTRYSMYFNKKYQRTGSLFEGPYKSIHLKEKPDLLLLTRYLHRTDGVSSYPEYLGTRETSWVKPKKGAGNYKNFVEKYELNQKERELLGKITFESKTKPLQASEPEEKNLKPQPRTPEILAIYVIFLMLLGLGLRNIKISATKSLAQPPTIAPEVLSESVQPTNTPEPKTMVIVQTSERIEYVNIRMEPTTRSTKIGEAKDGDTFEFVSINSGWYEVKLNESSTGFIKAEYTSLQDTYTNE